MFVVEIHFCFDPRLGKHIVAEHSEWPAGRAMVEIHFLFSFLVYFLWGGRDCLLTGDSIPRRFRCKEKSSTFFRAEKIDLTHALLGLHPEGSALKIRAALKRVAGLVKAHAKPCSKHLCVHPAVGCEFFWIMAGALGIHGLPCRSYIGSSHGVSFVLSHKFTVIDFSL